MLTSDLGPTHQEYGNGANGPASSLSGASTAGNEKRGSTASGKLVFLDRDKLLLSSNPDEVCLSAAGVSGVDFCVNVNGTSDIQSQTQGDFVSHSLRAYKGFANFRTWSGL